MPAKGTSNKHGKTPAQIEKTRKYQRDYKRKIAAKKGAEKKAAVKGGLGMKPDQAVKPTPAPKPASPVGGASPEGKARQQAGREAKHAANLKKGISKKPVDYCELCMASSFIIAHGLCQDCYQDLVDRIGTHNLDYVVKREIALMREEKWEKVSDTEKERAVDAYRDSVVKKVHSRRKILPLYEIVDGVLEINPHRGQRLVLDSKKQIVAALCGTQSGKTSIAPLWLYNEILKWDELLQRGEVVTDADFLVVSPTYSLLNRKLLPVFVDFFINILGIGEQFIQANRIDVTIARDDGTDYIHKIYFASAKNEESLASITAAAIVLDECGQATFGRGSWVELEDRLGSTQGRVLMATTLYNFGWLYDMIYLPFKEGSPRIDVIHFDSKDNPRYDMALWNHHRATMKPDVFSMRHRGIYARPLGQIYSCYNSQIHQVAPFAIQPTFKRYVGIDPGIVHHATVFLAEIPLEYQVHIPFANHDLPIYVAYETILTGSVNETVTNRKHAFELTERDDYRAIETIAGGAASEKYFRADYSKEGVTVLQPPTHEVSSGIEAVYDMLANRQLFVFNDQIDLINELQSYSKELDEQGNPTDKIADKSSYHRLDALRYICLTMMGDAPEEMTVYPVASGASLL